MKNALLFFSIFLCQISIGQVVINELDCDTPGIDNMEFVELRSDTPNFSLNGLILVFFNGSTSGGNTSYFTIDLDGQTTDINGLLLIGSNSVSPVPQLLISENVIQNGADAVALYQGNEIDFPDETLATIDNLIDVLIYGTSDSDDVDLIDIFNDHPDFINIDQINEGSGNNTNSIQRNNDGTYTAKFPTPRQLNDGSGILLNGVQLSTSQSQYNEGESFEVTITTEENVTQDLNIELLLNNEFFNSSDFSGNTSITIPSGQNTTSTTITLIDDSDDEGDEVASLRFTSLPATEYLALNNNIKIRIVDNDFLVAPYGIPTSPTYGIVSSTQPSDYYSSLHGLSDAVLRQAVQDIIADPNIVRAQTYNDIIDILNAADKNPANSNEVWLVYTEQGRAKLDFQTTSDNNGKWNREHTFPRSRGGFSNIEEDENRDGIDIFWTTNADSLRHGNSDAHALRAADGSENGARNNLHYGEYNGPTGNLGSFKGDVARSVLYMSVRYNGLEIVNGFPDVDGQLGDLSTLLEWHRNDPPDDFEMNRNNVIYNWQFNRNPFIDQPLLVDYIWGDNIGQDWNQAVTVHDIYDLDVQIYPNPTTNQLSISGLNDKALAQVYTIDGHQLKTISIYNNTHFYLNVNPGMYVLKIKSEGKHKIERIVVR